MKLGRNALERAFELARSGEARTVSEIKKKLKSEGYSLADFVGRQLSRQLRAIIEGRTDQASTD